MGASTAATGIDEAFGSPSVASIGPGSGLKTSSAVAPAAAAFCAFWKMKQTPRLAIAIRPRVPAKSPGSQPLSAGATCPRRPPVGVEGE